jgi:hypothetical protein
VQPNQVSRQVSIEVMGVSLYLSPVPIDLTSDHSFGLRGHLPSLLGACNLASDKVPTVVAEAATQ